MSDEPNNNNEITLLKRQIRVLEQRVNNLNANYNNLKEMLAEYKKIIAMSFRQVNNIKRMGQNAN